MYEFGVGVLIGGVQTIIGHPFDTIKILQQNKIKIKYASKILYNGVSIPLIFNGLSNSIMFGMYCQLNNNGGLSTPVSALVSGGLSSIFLTPHDYVKTQLQIVQKPVIRHLYRGFYMTTLRESLGSCIYFTGYEYGVKFLGNTDTSAFVSGGVSGVASWLFIYPIDVIKTRVMSGVAKTTMDAIRMGDMWSGVGACISRAFLVNGVSFLIYNKLIDN